MQFQEFSLMSHSKLIPFEFAHLLIFFVSIFYVVTTVIAAERLAITHRQWQRMANLNANVLADELEKLVNTRKPSGWSPLWSAINPTLRVNMWEDCEWKVLRLLFLREFDIGTEFDYSKYVNHKLSTKLGHSLHIHPSTWGLVMVVSLVFYVYKVIVPSEPLDDGHRRRLAAGPSEIKYCEVEVSPGDKEEGRWQCDYSDVQTNVSAGGNQTADICVLSFNKYEKEYVHVKATDIVTPLAVAWCLCISQGYVMYQLKLAIHRVMETKGCKSAVEMPKFLRRLNAEVSMRSLLPHVPMFEGGGDEFINCVLDNLKLSFFGTQDVISKKGDRGHSMYFICSGCADVVCDETILGSLVPGDYAGEMAILLDQPRSASIVARNRCAVFELDRDHLMQIGEEFPAAVQRMIDFAVKRRAAAQQGRWDEQRSLRDEHETVIEDHARKLSELQRQKENEDVDTARASIKSKIMSAEGLGDLGAVGKDLAKGVVQSLKANPISSVKGFVKKSAHTVGIPGTGAGAHSVHGAHGGKHLEKMVGAEQIMSHDRNHTCEEISEITMLLNCFAMGFYVLRMVPYLIPNMGGGLVLKILTHILLVTPCALVSLWMAPVTTKYSCLLDNVLFKDSDTIAEVYHTMTRLIALKNNIKDQLNKVALSFANDVGLDASQSSFDTIAEMMFENIASKSKRGGLRVSYVQLRKALSTFGVYMPRREHKQLMEFVDPDRCVPNGV
jgi:CRP-like cAMP-binding protein